MLNGLKTLFDDLSKSTCCFCGDAILDNAAQDISLTFADGSTQHLHAHGDCLRTRLHQDVPYLTPKELQDDA